LLYYLRWPPSEVYALSMDDVLEHVARLGEFAKKNPAAMGGAS